MRKFALFLCLLIFSLGSVKLAAAAELAQSLELLTSSSFDEKSKAISSISNTVHSNVEKIFKAMLDSNLYYVKKGKRIVLTQKEGSKYQIFDALSGEDLGLVNKRKIKKVSINNALRKQLKFEISRLKLTHAEAELRLAAVESLMGLSDAGTIEQLELIKASETDVDCA